MQSSYPASFERDMGCTESEWSGWLPAALGDVSWQRDGQVVHALLPDGRLRLEWRVEAPRAIALVRIPRLWVRFEFTDTTPESRYRFMRRFDLYMQRGGG